MNQQRALVGHLRELCGRRGIRFTAFSDDWIFCLQKGDRIAYVFGYDFGINSAAAKMICKDKTATSDLLGFHQVPRIEHRIFHSPQAGGFAPKEGSWHSMLSYLAAHPRGVVCKPNEGTGGNAVFLAYTPRQLEAAVYQVFARSRALCLSPFEDFSHEYRVALLCGEIEFVYRKVRPALTGDGLQSVRALLLSQLLHAEEFPKQMAAMKSFSEMAIEWDRIPAAGERVEINWRHNLGQGAHPEMVAPEDPVWNSVTDLALRAAKALTVELASVDIAATADELKVLEVNSGIMMENLHRLHPQGDAMASKFYDRIVCLALGISSDP